MKFGLTPTPKAFSPWGILGRVDSAPAADLHLQKFSKIGGDQNPTNSCVWWAIANAIHNVLSYEGISSDFWASVLAGYYVTRLRSNGGDRSRIVDFGCRPPDAAMVLRELGMVPSRSWPFIPRQVDVEPPYDALVSALPDWIRLKRIIAPEGGYGAGIRHVIHNLHRPVLIGQEVNQKYVGWKPGHSPWTFSPPMDGRHMELIDSYTTDGPLTVSSWGDLFRRQVAWPQVEKESVSDLWYPEIDLKKALVMLGKLK